jgi:hypothetical protein
MVTNNNSGNSGGKYIYFKFWQKITSRMKEGMVQTTVLKAIEDYQNGNKSVHDLRDLLIEFCTTEKEDNMLYALLPINNAKEDAIDDAWNELWAATDDDITGSEEKRRKGRERYAKKKAEYELLKQKEEKGEVLTEEEVMKIKNYQEHRDEQCEYQRDWRANNPDYQRDWRANNPDYQRDWRANNPNYESEWRAKKTAELVSLKQKLVDKKSELTNEEVMKLKKAEEAKDKKNKSRNQWRAEKTAEYELLKQKQAQGVVLTKEEMMKITKFEDAGERNRERSERNRERNREYMVAEGFKVCLLPNGRKAFFKPSAAEQQVNREDQPYYEQDSFRKYFENGLVRALREYNSARVGGNLALMSASQLKVLYDCIRMKENHMNLPNIPSSTCTNRGKLLEGLKNLGDLNLYFRNSAAMLRTMSLNEAILAIPPRTKLGLKIKEDKELGGVVITRVQETCTFKDIVEIGWRITSIDNVPVTSKDDFNTKDPNQLRVMKFAKPIHRTLTI